MKIIDVKVHVLKSPLEQPFAFSQGWVRQRSATLVEVITDEGLVGWGEAFAQGLEPPEVAAAVIHHALKPLLLGENPIAIEVLWHKMYHATRDYGRKGSVIAAISAIDVALWDLSGHFYNQPISTLLGGAFRSSVQPYATGFYRLHGQGEASRLAEEALRHYENGFRVMKVKLGYGVSDDFACMKAVASALEGKPVQLMVDVNHAYGRRDALRLGLELAQYDLRWYEEPVVPEDIAGYAEVRQRLPMAIAGGENEHTMYGFRDLIASGGIDIAQPDISSCGGLSAGRHIVALAQASGVQVIPHVWGSAIAQAAALQFVASLPVTNHSIFSSEPIFEYDQSSHPFRRDLVSNPTELTGHRIAINTGPGLGVQVDRAVIAAFSA